MPERVYLNRIPGQQRIHIEITAGELPALLWDLAVRPGASSTTLALLRLLQEASDTLGTGTPTPATDQEVAPEDQLRDLAAAAARTVTLRIGPNSRRLLDNGEQLPLSGGEADDIARAVLDVLRPFVCGASTEGWAASPIGPCLLARDHEGPVHLGPGGARWLRREDIPRTGREILHAAPAAATPAGPTPCCGLTLAELPRTDRITRNPAAVTCPARATRTDRQPT